MDDMGEWIGMIVKKFEERRIPCETDFKTCEDELQLAKDKCEKKKNDLGLHFEQNKANLNLLPSLITKFTEK